MPNDRMNSVRKIGLFLTVCVTVCCGRLFGRTPDTAVAQRLASLETETWPLPYHDSLLTAIDFFAGQPLPTAFPVYEPVFEAALQKYRLPADFKYIPLVMSRMKLDNATDDRCGVWALPALVALRYGLSVEPSRDERYMVRAAAEAACRYLADLYRLYGDWWSCVLAYANSPAALSRVALTPGEEDFPWHMFETHALSDVEIVRSLLACIYVYDASERIGFSQKMVDSLSLVEHKMMSGAVPPTKPAAAATASRAPAPATSTAAKPAAAVATSAPRPAAETAEPVIYTVKLGDTLSQIAERHHVKLSDLKRWNNLKRDFIREGQKLKIYP